MWGVASFILLCTIIQAYMFKQQWEFRKNSLNEIDENFKKAYEALQPHVAFKTLQEKEACCVCGSSHHKPNATSGKRVFSIHLDCCKNLEIKYVASPMRTDINKIECSPGIKNRMSFFNNLIDEKIATGSLSLLDHDIGTKEIETNYPESKDTPILPMPIPKKNRSKKK